MDNVVVKIGEMWKYSMGVSCIIGDKCYMYCGRDDMNGGEYLDLTTGSSVYEEDFAVDEEVIITGKVDLDRLVDFKVARLVLLIDEGWTIDGSMGLGAELDELEALVKVQSIIKVNKSKDML